MIVVLLSMVLYNCLHNLKKFPGTEDKKEENKMGKKKPLKIL